MMRVGWLADSPSYVGGAELTSAEFVAAAPDDIEVVPCPHGSVIEGLDQYVISNCVTYSLDEIKLATAGSTRRTFKYHNDIGSWLADDARAWLNDYATPICCSPLQAEYMGFEDPLLIPPPVNLERFYEAASRVNGGRAGVVSVGSWRNRGKGAHVVEAWAAGNGGVDFYGGGAFAPRESREVAYEGMPAILARYSTFVFLPEVIEPFGRSVVEAWAAGTDLVINGLVGARYWITEAPDKLESAASDFWSVVLGELR